MERGGKAKRWEDNQDGQEALGTPHESVAVGRWLLRSQLRSRDCRQGAVLVYTLTPPLLESTSLAEVCRSPTP